jgi:hypothetical protein
MKPIVQVLSAAALTLPVAACGGGGAKSAGPVPTILPAAEQVGFIGLPPKGAEPSSPKRGELVASWWGTVAGDWGKSRFWVYGDGRLISLREADIPEGANPGSTGFLEQRLTPEGVELLRSAVVGSDMPLIPRDVTSELPKRAWADRTLRAYVPSRFAVCYDRGDEGALGHRQQPWELGRLWPLLPARAKDVLHGNEMDSARSKVANVYCWDLTTNEARTLAVVLDDAWFDRGQRSHDFQLSYESKRPDPMDPAREPVGLSFEPILPNGEWTCSPCG